MAKCTCRRTLTHSLPADKLLRAATLLKWLEKNTDLGREKAAEVAMAAARRGLLTAEGKLRKGARLPL